MGQAHHGTLIDSPVLAPSADVWSQRGAPILDATTTRKQELQLMEFPTVTYVPIPTRDYPGTVREYEPTVGQFGDQIKWTIALGDVEDVDGQIHEDKTIWHFTPAAVSSKNKLGGLAAACGWDISAGVPLRSEDIIGKPIIVSVVVSTRDDGTLTNKIMDVRRPSRKPVNGKAAAPVKQAAMVDDDDAFEPPF